MMNLFSLEFERQVLRKAPMVGSISKRLKAPFWVHLEVGQDLFGDWVLFATKRSTRRLNGRRVQCLSHRVLAQKSLAQEAVKGFLEETISGENKGAHTRCVHLDYHEDENLFAWVPGDFPLELLKRS